MSFFAGFSFFGGEGGLVFSLFAFGFFGWFFLSFQEIGHFFFIILFCEHFVSDNGTEQVLEDCLESG